jgi:NADH:ubiquinone oxidoreductase subunit K
MNNETLIIVLVSACLIVNLITLIVVILSRKTKLAVANVAEEAVIQVAAAQSQAAPPVKGIVFCRGCGNQFDSTLDVCPHCNRAR